MTAHVTPCVTDALTKHTYRQVLLDLSAGRISSCLMLPRKRGTEGAHGDGNEEGATSTHRGHAGRRSKRLDKETEGQREARLRRMRQNRARQLASETEEQRKVRLEGLRQYQTRRLASETGEQRKARLEGLRQYQTRRLASEKEEQRKSKLEGLRQYHADKASSQMASKSTSGPSLSNTDDCGSSSRAFQKKGPAEGSSGKAEAVPKVTPSSNACTCLRGTSYALRVCLVFRFRFLYGFMFVCIYIIIYIYIYISVTKWRRSGFLEFTKLLLALSSFAHPFD